MTVAVFVMFHEKRPRDTTCFILAEDSHEKRQVSYETKQDLGNCFDYSFPSFPVGCRHYKAECGGLGKKGLRRSGSTSPCGKICSLATMRDRWEDDGGGSRRRGGEGVTPL